MALRFACAHAWRAILFFCLAAATSGCGDGSGTTTASADGDASERTKAPPPDNTPRDSVSLSWIPPTENTDGSYLDDLSGYRIYSGPSPDDLTPRVTLDSGLTRYVAEPLAPDEIYFAISALNSEGRESDLSGAVKVPT